MLLLCVIAAAALPAAALRLPLSDGPPPGHTGGFGEPTCRVCHQPGEPRRGSVTIEGLPASFIAGQTYVFEVVSRAPGLTRAGFQLAARFASGAPAGVLGTEEPTRVGFSHDSTRQLRYAQHTAAGTAAHGNEQRWRMTWQAPRQRMPVVFHAASVIASDDNSPLDDDVVTTADTVAAAIP